MKFDLDKDKLKKAGIWFIVYCVLLTAVEYAATVFMQHKAFEPNVMTIVVAALLCAVATVYVPRIWR